MISARNRDVSRKKALRKRRITRQLYHCWSNDEWEYYDNLHQYSKNKIHCSCPCCSSKTRNKGSRRYKSGNYNRALHYTAADIRKVQKMDEDLREAGFYAPQRKRDKYS